MPFTAGLVGMGSHLFPPSGAQEDQGGVRPWRGREARFIKSIDPEGGERLKRLLERKSLLLDRNVYGERFTERQFDLVFDPLLASAYEKAQILELLGGEGRDRRVARRQAFHGQGPGFRPSEGPGQEEHGGDRRVRGKAPCVQEEVKRVMDKVGKVWSSGAVSAAWRPPSISSRRGSRSTSSMKSRTSAARWRSSTRRSPRMTAPCASWRRSSSRWEGTRT